MRIVLIEVGGPRRSPAWTAYLDEAGRFAMPSVGLLSLAALVRPHDEVRILDEKVDGEVETVDADVVGISFKSMYAKRAYALADRLRDHGTKVVLGGIHASLQAAEASQHADAVVVGEGEGVWRTLLDEVEAGKLRAIYRSGDVHLPLDALPRLPVSLTNHSRYMCHSLQSARGCSFTCEFCPTRAMFGDGYRLRDPQTVMSEVRELIGIEDKPVFFTDNVFGAGDMAFIDQLTRGLHSAGVRYAVICDWMAMSRDLARMLARRGCSLVGINLTGRMEPEEESAVDALHDAGLAMWGYLMFGFEEDTPDVFERAIQRIRRHNFVSVAITLLTPFPGTPMTNRITREGRVHSADCDLLDQNHLLFAPKRMTSEQLQQGYDFACCELADLLGFHRAVAAMSDEEHFKGDAAT